MNENRTSILLTAAILVLIGSFMAVSYVAQFEPSSQDIDVTTLFMMGLAIFFFVISTTLYLFLKGTNFRKLAAIMCFFTFASFGNLVDEINGENVGIVKWWEIVVSLIGLAYAVLEYFRFKPMNLLIHLKRKWITRKK